MNWSAGVVSSTCMHYVTRLRARNSGIDQFISSLAEVGRPSMVGGLVRDAVLGRRPRDLDIVVECSEGALQQLMGLYPHRRNSFGGYKVEIAGLELDVWTVKSTWAFRFFDETERS